MTSMTTTEHHTNGYEAGKAAGSWVLDGNSSTETAARILQGYDDGDPEIMDMQPAPLSGENAGDSMVELLGDEHTFEDAEAFENGFGEGFWDEVRSSARALVGDDA